MVTIRLTNSKTRKKEVFEPLKRDDVRIYVCGPTVYDRAHLGNARPVIVFDTLYRLLRHVYGEGHVTYVRNFTDVDDKINAEAQRRKGLGRLESLEELIRERTEETIAWYHADMRALGALRPAIRDDRSDEGLRKAEPRATEYIGAMITMIEDLIAKGHAYEKEGHVLFRVRSYKDYGALSGRSIDDMIAGARVEVAPFKEDPMDFVLWKPSDADLPGWDSPWGRGRPGWHIECSAMSYELLGESFDIHGGGLDLQFPHHENEIAQSCCAHPEGGFARVWMHNEMLQVEGKKMSKSLGNFFTVRELLEQGHSGPVIRMVFLGTHYRKPMNWTEEKANQDKRTLWRWQQRMRGVVASQPFTEVVEALADDLNTSAALTAMHTKFNDLSSVEAERQFKASLDLLGLDLSERVDDIRDAVQEAVNEVAMLKDLTEKLTKLREVSTASKDFTPVDAMKSTLIAAGVEVRMSKAGVELVPGPDFDPSKLSDLL